MSNKHQIFVVIGGGSCLSWELTNNLEGYLSLERCHCTSECINRAADSIIWLYDEKNAQYLRDNLPETHDVNIIHWLYPDKYTYSVEIAAILKPIASSYRLISSSSLTYVKRLVANDIKAILELMA